MPRIFVAVRSVLFVYLLALIMTIGSERMFWFWSTEFTVHFELAAYYSIATVVGIGLMRRFKVTSWWSLMLVTPIIAFIVEGVITPVIYSGGPLVPIFPAWFGFWHGIFAFVGMAFGVRRLLLQESMIGLSLAATGLGAFWGLWSATLRLPENVNDVELVEAEGGPLVVLDPGAFALYAAAFTAIFIVGHFLVSFVWPPRGSSSSATSLAYWEWLTLGVVLAIVIGWTLVVPWALPMFGVYCGIQIMGLRWHRRGVDEAQPTMLDQLHGRVRLRALVPLALMAPVAAGTYAALWTLDPSDEALRVVMYGTIAVQGVIGFVVVVWALIRARKLRTSSPEAFTEAWSDSPSAPSQSH